MRQALRRHLRDLVALLAAAAIGVAVAGYILANQAGVRIPLIEPPPFRIYAELSSAQAVTPGQGQSVRVAGVEIGQVGAVDLEQGRAVVRLDIDPRYRRLLRTDASALLRSKTGLKDMFIEVDPGDGPRLKEGARIPLSDTLPDVNQDEVLSSLDADTRDYLKLLITGAGKGLQGHGTELGEALARLGPLHRDLARFASVLAERRRNLRRVVHEYGLVMSELAQRDRTLRQLVRDSNRVFGAFASEDRNLRETVRRLPGALDTTRAALARVEPFARELRPTLRDLIPVVRELPASNAALRDLASARTATVRDRIRPFARETAPFLLRLGVAGSGLAQGAPEITGTLLRLNRLFNIGAYNPGGAEGISEGCEREGRCTAAERNRNEGYLYWLAWTGNNTVSLFSTSDATGPYRRISLGGLSCSTVAGLILQQIDQIPDSLAGLRDQLTNQLNNVLNALDQSGVSLLAGDCDLRSGSGSGGGGGGQ